MGKQVKKKSSKTTKVAGFEPERVVFMVVVVSVLSIVFIGVLTTL